MVRIWQGKALLAAMVIPLIFYLSWTIVMKKPAEHTWLLYAMANLSACLLSSMGIILARAYDGSLHYPWLRPPAQYKNCGVRAFMLSASIVLGASYILIMVFRKWGIL